MRHILTPRLNIFPCDIGVIEAAQQGHAHLTRKIAADVP